MGSYAFTRDYYRITIADTNISYDDGVHTLSSANNGFIDPHPVWESTGFSSKSPFTTGVNDARGVVATQPNSQENCNLKARGHVRWKQLGRMLADRGGLTYFGDLVVTDGKDLNRAPTSVAFTVGYNQFEDMYVYNLENCNLDGTTTTPPETFSGSDALTRMVQRLLISKWSRNHDVYNVTYDSDSGYPVGVNLIDIEVLPAADITGSDTAPTMIAYLDTNSNITINKISNVG